MSFEMIHPRDDILRTMERIYRYRMTTTSGGNLSIRDADGSVWITPASVDKGDLQRRDIVRVRPDGSVDGPHRPSSEHPFHQAVYDARPDVGAVVHAHPVALVAFSICGRAPDTRLFHQARFVCGEPAIAPYAAPGSQALGERIGAAFAEGPNCVILENHGVVTAGATLSEAYQRFEAMEFAARTILKASRLGEVRCLSDEKLQDIQSHRLEMGQFPHRAATSREKELRLMLQRFVERGCRQRLLISTEGSFSARVDENAFLITPSQEDREMLTVDQMVLVDGDRCEAGKRPSRAVGTHQAIYKRHPEIGAIVLTHPVNATAFSVTDAPLDPRTIPESYVFLRDVRRVPFGVQHQSDGRIADYVGPNSPVALLESDGVLVTGKSVLDAYDRLEVLESTADALINARSIGDVAIMSDERIDELKMMFGLQ